MSQLTENDGFHEIQLNGKQLVFVFIAATVVSVLIFLFGVLVGRGVRVGQAGISEASATGAPDTSARQAASGPVPTPAGSDPTAAAAPPAPADDLSYFDRLQKPNAPAEKLKSTPERGAAIIDRPLPSAAVETPSRPVPPEPAPAPASSPARADPAGEGFAVQIAALNERSEADAIARRLSSKGYAAYVLPPADGTPPVYRVRVGKFPTRREAESIAARLQQEERLKPWVTR